MATTTSKPSKISLSAAQVRAKVEDWERRINDLYDEVEKWSKADSLLPKPQRSVLLQRNEHPLQQFGVPPRELPTLTFRFEKNRVMFTPSVLWIIGANGRLNFAVNDDYYMLVDLKEGPGATRDWNLVSKDARKNFERFNQDTYLAIVNGAI